MINTILGSYAHFLIGKWPILGPKSGLGQSLQLSFHTVNSEIFVRILFSRIALKDIHVFAPFKIRNQDMIYIYQ